jgi:hypothetical protein
MSYADMAQRALADPAYSDGLRDAARIARAQGVSLDAPPCPASMAAVYIDAVAEGQEP